MRSRRLLVLLTSLALLLTATASTVTAAPSTNVGTKAVLKVQRLGTAHITGAAPKAGDPGALVGETRPDAEVATTKDSRKIGSPSSDSRVPSAFIPRPAVQSVVDATSTSQFAGLNHRDQRLAGTGSFANTQFSLEPPDQGLCVGGGYVVETINTAVRVRDTTGATVAGPAALNQFFGLTPEIIRSSPLVFGDFSSDPKCYYDAPTNRWFLTLLQIDTDSATGGLTNHAHQLIAVSVTGNPAGSWYTYSVDTTDDGTNGTPTHPLCPCYGDQPLIGADANGFYVTTNEYPIHGAGFNGAMVYAFSKSGLEAGTLGTVTSIFEPTLAEGQAYSLQPTTTPAGAAFASANGGTEHFLSALEFTGGLDNRIALWTLSNTSSLSSTPNLTMSVSVISSEVYGLPAAMQQKAGPTPLADLIKSKLAPTVLGVKSTPVPLSAVNSNDDRMNQAVYLGGHVWGALNTRMKAPTGAVLTGIAWFDVNTAGTPAVADQGYVALAYDNAVFPSVAANASGDVLVAFTLLGQDYYPSAAYQWLNHNGDTGTVRLVKAGDGPQDGFTGYIPEDPVDGGISRWGDYSAATADGSGNIWFATETINQSCSFSEFLADTSCGGTRTILANWGTTIAKVTP